MNVFPGGEDSNPREEVSERAEGVHVAARPQREARAGVAAQTGTTQGTVPIKNQPSQDPLKI